MSRTLALKTSSILICFIIFAAMAYAVFAQEATTSTAVKKPVLQKINIRKEKVEDKIESLKEKMASRTAVLKAKLETFRDKRKAEIADRVNTNLNRINANQTEQMLKHLNQMSAILDKLEARAGSSTAVVSARNNIATTSAAVAAQAQKDYTITVSSESRVKADAKQTRDKLHSDLLALRKLVINAKQSVGSAIRAARPAAEKEGTASGRE